MAERDSLPRRAGAGRHLYPGLVLAQTLQSFELFVYGHLEVVPGVSITPEYFVLFSLTGLLLMGALIPSVAHGRGWALRLAKTFAVLEVLNGAGHIMVPIVQWEYYPGLWTAPIILIFAAALGRSLRHVP
ncbi:MAG TPA: hypothetical protein VE646_09915 [Actinomycetota bacterium]|nr:hypothetical protein [Actinomycetota bacterium]